MATAIAIGIGSLTHSVAGVAHADPSSTSIDQGYDLGEIPQPRAIAMAGAQEAWGGSTIAVFKNPANLPLYRVYHLEGLAAWGPEARRQTYGGAVVDSSTSRLAGGFGGTWSQMDPDGIKRSWADLRLAIAYPLGDRLSIGVTGRYLRATQRVASGPLGASLASDGTSGDPMVNEFTFDAGAAVSITEGLRLGVRGLNLTAPSSTLAPLALAGGIGYSNQTFTIEADTLIDFKTNESTRPRAMVGAEFLAADHFPLRAGYRYDDGTKTNAVSLGVGYIERKFSVEFGGRRDVSGDHPATLLSIGLRFFIDAGAGSGGQDSQPDSF
ncbi:hypothetical protein AKJ09_04237 [Labilithrix luteola]|uniref:PorV/PorQ family protein n=1 Tax=Labilithrix luteola TaxID=1391654 RepID=A0A0K1PVL5_9BACT|nr:porin family protein [Labilithrix luteola]AKU97573.1 hypothetical protein AKJ09_04237 [Labilithrix luteola]